MEELLRMLQDAVMLHLKCSVSFTVGPEEDSFEDAIAGYPTQRRLPCTDYSAVRAACCTQLTSRRIRPRNMHFRQVRAAAH